jgi:hypothetical protein
MLQGMLEISKLPEYDMSVQSKISRKLALCQRLKTFFDESKSLSNLNSLEYQSTALMISAKMFENEEDVKSFKKHGKCCGQSTMLLKSIELEILGKYSWEIDHFCTVDFALDFIANHFWRSSDFMLFDADELNLNFFAIFGKKFGVNTRSMASALKIPFEDLVLEVQVCEMKNLDEDDRSFVFSTLLNSFKNIYIKVLKEYCFKSKLRIVFCLLTIIQLKEYFFGVEYHLFNKMLGFIRDTISR